MEKQSAPYVFVSGSFHGAWCWFKVLNLLKTQGYRAEAVELPSHGTDFTPLKDVTLDSYVNAVGKVLDKYNEPVILVGHSRAGIVISQAAEKYSQKISKLVYLAAFLIPNGEPMIPTAMSDQESLLGPNLILNEAEGWHFPKPESFREVFYHDCSAEDVQLAQLLLTSEPNLPVLTPLNLTDNGYGKVPRIYIETLEDKTVSPGLQKKMYSKTPCEKVISIRSSHSPFLSMPDELVEILKSVQEATSHL